MKKKIEIKITFDSIDLDRVVGLLYDLDAQCSEDSLGDSYGPYDVALQEIEE